MSVIQIRDAQREGARLLIGMSGWTGSGKTRTALEFGYGLANFDTRKIGFLDTENRRGSLYSDVFYDHPTHPTNKPFLIADLEPPFSPQRYIEAIKAFQQAGVEVLIIDSSSHEHEGTGGCIEIAEAGNPKLPNWNKAKAEHKKFMNALLASDMHIICCVRAREKSKPEKDANGKTVYVDLGLQEIQEKNFMFEMTVSFMMFDMGKRHEVRKCPGALAHLFPGTGYIGSSVGKAIRDWVDGAKQTNPEVERARNTIRVAAQGGMAVLQKAWGELAKETRAALGAAFLEAMKRSAQDHDKLAAEQAEGEKQAQTTGSAQPEGTGNSALAQLLAAGRAAAKQQTGEHQQAVVEETKATQSTEPATTTDTPPPAAISEPEQPPAQAAALPSSDPGAPPGSGEPEQFF